MRPFFALLGRQIVETRWFLTLAALALFGFGWLFVFATSKIETQRGGRRIPEEVTSGDIEMGFWSTPFIFLPVVAWAVARGASSIGGEVERGTMDLVLSRPIPRSSYLMSQVILAVSGLLVLGLALLMGNTIGSRFNILRSPPTMMAIARPSLNLSMLGLAVYGYAIMFSSWDRVSWRPNLIASSITFAGFVASVVSSILARTPSLEAWSNGLKKISIFTAYNPVAALMKPETLSFNLMILAAIGLSGIVIAFVIFTRRDLPTS